MRLVHFGGSLEMQETESGLVVHYHCGALDLRGATLHSMVTDAVTCEACRRCAQKRSYPAPSDAEIIEGGRGLGRMTGSDRNEETP